MANTKTNSASGTSNKQPTAAEMKEFYSQNKSRLENFENADNALKILRDAKKATSRTINSVDKESLRTYLQNISTNESNLRGLSRYLYYRSHVYFRIIKFFANMLDLNARSIIPNYDLTKDNDPQKTLKTYYQTAKILNGMNLQSELIKMYVIALREDVAYGCVYYDEDGGLFIMPLDPDYCKIDGFYNKTGDYSFKFDMSYWRSRQEQLELIGEPWQSMYSSYQSDARNNRWQNLPDENSICIKFRSEDYDIVVPPFSGIFNELLSLISLEDIQSLNDEQQIYKLVYMPMETISGSKESDDWCISPDILVKYFNKMVEAGLPDDYVTSAIVPGKELKMLDFSNNATTDNDRVSEATQTLLDTAGGGELLMGSNINSSAAFKAAMMANTEFAISTLLPQTQAWVNRFISYYVSNPCKVKFAEISIYTRDDYRESLLSCGQYGLPTAIALNTLNGFSELDTLALNFLEQDCLDLAHKLIPLNSSYTSSGNASDDATYNPETGQGAPQKDEGDLSESGDRMRNK